MKLCVWTLTNDTSYNKMSYNENDAQTCASLYDV